MKKRRKGLLIFDKIQLTIHEYKVKEKWRILLYSERIDFLRMMLEYGGILFFIWVEDNLFSLEYKKDPNAFYDDKRRMHWQGETSKPDKEYFLNVKNVRFTFSAVNIVSHLICDEILCEIACLEGLYKFFTFKFNLVDNLCLSNL